ncbi:hypothetical protein LINGRAHAP2_LOCUS10986 [Linum grandiflorum]
MSLVHFACKLIGNFMKSHKAFLHVFSLSEENEVIKGAIDIKDIIYEVDKGNRFSKLHSFF